MDSQSEAEDTLDRSHPAVRPILGRLRAGARATLGGRLVGIYLYGSLATGDFDPERSDVDVLVVTEDRLTEPDLDRLRAAHAAVAAAEPRWAARLEGSYIPRRALRRYDPADTLHPRFEPGVDLHFEQHDRDWVIQYHVVRERGVVVCGPDPRALIDPVAPADLRFAVRDILRMWWVPMLDDPAPLLRRGYQAYTVLTLCRMLYTLATGEVTSKPRAVAWAIRHVAPEHRPLIRAALAVPRDGDFDHLAETRRFIADVWERSRAWGS